MEENNKDLDRVVHDIVAAARRVHETLGPGFLESIYGKALVAELKDRGIRTEREKSIKIWYASQIVGRHVLDLVVEETVVVEVKAGRGIVPVHAAQVRSYLHATAYPVGVILNFGLTEIEWDRIPGGAGRAEDPAPF
jgi:GxxExxY protein